MTLISSLRERQSQASIAKGGLDHSTKLHSVTSDSKEVNVQKEVDFAYCEKVTPLPKSASPFAEKSPEARARTEKLTKDIDLNLL